MIPLDKLKTDYKTFESKKHLSAYYDVYLADRRIYHLLPRHLGKSFFIKKRWAPFEVVHVMEPSHFIVCVCVCVCVSDSLFQLMFRNRTCVER